MLRFDDYTLDAETREFRKGGDLVKLKPQPAQVLALLASRPGEVITREEIQRALWQDDTYVDFDLGINSCIRQIRIALEDNAGSPRYVQTLARKGYRFVNRTSRQAAAEEGQSGAQGADTTTTTPSHASSAGWPGRDVGRKPFMWIPLAVLLSLLAIFLALRRSDAPPARAVTRAVIPLVPGSSLALDGDDTSMAISPDGRYIAYVARDGDASQLYLRASGQLEARAIDGEGARQPFFSHDSQWLAYYASVTSIGTGRVLKKVAVSGGAPVTIADLAGAHRGGSWGPDGRIVLGTRLFAGGLSQVWLEEGAAEPLTVPKRERLEESHRFPQMLPGGKTLLLTMAMADTESWGEASIAVLSLETGEYRVVLEGGRFARYSPSGHLVYARGGGLLAVPFDPRLRSRPAFLAGWPSTRVHGRWSEHAGVGPRPRPRHDEPFYVCMGQPAACLDPRWETPPLCIDSFGRLEALSDAGRWRGRGRSDR